MIHISLKDIKILLHIPFTCKDKNIKIIFEFFKLFKQN